MKKHYCKRKKVVIDALDGKIINEHKALKLTNVEEYLEKNGFKIIKILSIFFVFIASINYVNAIEIIDLNLPSLNSYQLAFTLNLLLILIGLSVLCIVLGLKYSMSAIYYLGCLILLFVGIMIIANNFNPLIGIFISFISVFLVWSIN
jgi:hypothetical protein